MSFLAVAAQAAQPQLLSHAMHVDLDPHRHGINGLDTLRFAAPVSAIEFSLYESLEPGAVEDGDRIREISSGSRDMTGRAHSTEGVTLAEEGEPIRRWRLETREGKKERWILRFRGQIWEDVSKTSFSREKVGAEIRATVGDEGIFLSGGQAWYPLIDEGMARHRITTTLPEQWHSLTQGRLIVDELFDGRRLQTWNADFATDGLILVGGQYEISRRKHGETSVETWFFPDDAHLAEAYLDDCMRYLDLYESFLSPYPFSKFAVVENFFPTGYGMPGWTLLGQQVLRLPFIRKTSLGHEIAHNWWGNSVFVGDGGNWCEGLTVYCADYLYKEMEDPVAARGYRKTLLKDFTHYVRDGNDFPLADFVSRHSASSRAVGYGKSMMVFHMIEERIGRPAFRQALREVIDEKQWAAASWTDFFRAAAQAGGLGDRGLDSERKQWIDKAGAPLLSLGEVRFGERGLDFSLTQSGGIWSLRVPVRITTADGGEDFQVELDAASSDFHLETGSRPEAISIDPDYNVFRRLHPGEMEATLSQIMGDAEPLFLMETGLDDSLADAFRSFAAIFSEGEPEIHIGDTAAREDSRTVIWLGRKAPPFVDAPAQLRQSPFFTVFTGENFDPSGSAIVYTQKRGPGRGLMAVLSASPSDVTKIARKVPHYGKYSYLAFESGRNRLKGNWETGDSPLTRRRQ